MEEIQYIDRRGYHSYKWDYSKKDYAFDDLLPLTVADMDFKCPACVRDVIRDYVEMGALGYYVAPEAYFQNFIDWEKKRHNMSIQQEWLRVAPGVVVAMSWVLSELFLKGDACMILSPVYGPIRFVPKRNGMKVVPCEILKKDGCYTIDFRDFEAKIIQNNVKVFILCSPHNPIGRVWTKEELHRLAEICERHDVLILSDEIHQDIIMPGQEQISMINVVKDPKRVIVLTSPAKTFNIAGLENSFMIIPDEENRSKIDALQDRICMHSGNSLGHIGCMAAYGGGEEWLDRVLECVYENYVYARETLLAALPKLVISPLEGTFLLWVDFRGYTDRPVRDVLAEKVHLLVGDGRDFGGDAYRSFARINLATSKEIIRDAVERIVRAF